MFDCERRSQELTDTKPGPELGAVLASVDRFKLNGHELVLLMQARNRQLAHLQAELYADMVEVSYCPPGGPESAPERDAEMVEFAADEIRAALTLTRRAADTELDLAWRLRERLTHVWEALRDGVIDVRRARTTVYGTDHLDEETARQVALVILERAPDMTTGQIGAAIRKLALEIDPDDAAHQFELGVADRYLIAEPNPDGTGNLSGRNLAPERVVAIRARIDALAQALKRHGEERTLDQLRADVFLDLLEGSEAATSKRRGVVDIHVDLASLAGMSEASGHIDGWGPVLADIARQVVVDQSASEWRFTVTDDRGEARYGTTRRRPSAGQVREVQGRNRKCVFPGCRMPARDSDIDHVEDWAFGGPTVSRNLAPLCRHDHRVKHEAGWRLQAGESGSFRWTSRLGHTYVASGAPP